MIGLATFPLVRQQQAFDCGPACMRMACDFLEFHRGLPLREVTRLSGANPATGTTEMEMARGLGALGLAWQRPHASGTDDLRATLRAGSFVMLRTLLPGGHKHWVVTHGWDGDRFLIACPGRGAARWTDGFTNKVWSARGYDHFALPADRAAHTVALAWERKRLPTSRPPHERTLAEFLEDRPVIPDARLTGWHRGMIRRAAEAIAKMPHRRDKWLLPYSAAPGLLFFAVPRTASMHDMYVLDEASGRVAGGIHEGLRWVEPPFRGRGIGAEIALAAHSVPGLAFLAPSSYSEAGHASRVAAHRIAVERALAAGLPVPEEVLRDYPQLGGPPRGTRRPSDGAQYRLF